MSELRIQALTSPHIDIPAIGRRRERRQGNEQLVRCAASGDKSITNVFLGGKKKEKKEKKNKDRVFCESDYPFGKPLASEKRDHGKRGGEERSESEFLQNMIGLSKDTFLIWCFAHKQLGEAERGEEGGGKIKWLSSIHNNSPRISSCCHAPGRFV